MGVGAATRQVYSSDSGKFEKEARRGAPKTQTDIIMEKTTLQIAMESGKPQVDI
jgi:hypothetical protein